MWPPRACACPVHSQCPTECLCTVRSRVLFPWLSKVNHACEPNLKKTVRLEQAQLEATAVMQLVPGAPLRRGQLTIDYWADDGEPTFPCKCGSARCRSQPLQPPG